AATWRPANPVRGHACCPPPAPPTPSPRGRCGTRPRKQRRRTCARKQRRRARGETMTDPHAWFSRMRFGLFVHFGLYSTLARHEWVMTTERTAPEEYEKNAAYFDPDRFDAADIARSARQAGMRYAVLTTKHHEGFAMFDTALSDYNSVAVCGRDFVAE